MFITIPIFKLFEMIVIIGLKANLHALEPSAHFSTTYDALTYEKVIQIRKVWTKYEFLET